MSDAIIEFLIVAAVALGVGGGLWFARWRRRTLRGATPCVPIAGLTPGSIARVRGRVVLEEVVESPFARSKCAYWRLQVSFRERSTSQQGLVWYQSIAREARRDFRLRDATGTVRVAGTGAGFDLLPMVHRTDLPEHMARFLKDQGVPVEADDGTPRVFGFEEWALTEHVEVLVSGRVIVGSDGPVIGAPDMPASVAEEKPDFG